MTGRLGQTPSQTVGPFFSMRLGGEGQNRLVPAGIPGRRIRVEGRVLDGTRAHVEDALIEVWQADASGRYRHPDDLRHEMVAHDDFIGFGRALSRFETGEYWIESLKPGLVSGSGGRPQAPHLSLIIQARGMLNPSFTRVYFSDEAEANHADEVLSLVPGHRRHTLIAHLEQGTDPSVYRFDIKFQGDDETVFFEF